jgi:hypothetical protein
VQAVTGKYKDVGIDGADYLEKIVQMPFQMPRLSPSAFKGYLNELLPSDLKAAAEVLSIGLRPNPRAVKRFVNILRLQDLLAHNRGVDPYDVTVLAAVLLARSTMPEFYSRLEGDPTLLLRVAEDVQTAEEGAVPDWDEQVIRLVKVLADSPQGVPADVAAYIDLAAASRPPDSAAEQGMEVTPSMLRTMLRQQQPGSPLTLRGAKFARGEDFSRIQLSKADLSTAQLAEVRLQGADLSGTLLVDADLRGADLTNANLADADLAGANLTGAILTGTDLRRAELDRAVLTDAELSDAQYEDIPARSGGAAPPSTQEAPPPADDERLHAERTALIEQVGERLSQLPTSEDLVDLTLLVRGDLSELADPYRVSADIGREPTALPSSQILNLFQQTNQELLIIGDPGSGKTTLALRLVAELRVQAEQHLHAPVPVLLQIAGWSSPAPPLREWLAEELSKRYGMALMIANLLVDQGALICVLDGLDELSPRQRHRFIETTKTYVALSRKEHGSARMVVTTRPVGGLDLAIQLRLRGAVELQPLSHADVSMYLRQHAHSEEARDQVQQFIQNNPAFDLRSPLLLQMMLRTFEIRGTLPSSHRELIDQFAHDQLGGLGRKDQFDPQAAKTWLVALAKHLSSSEQLTFSSEDPDIRSVLREQGLRGREVPAFLRASADQGLLSEVSENEYSFTHLLLQEYFSEQLRDR